ncbi:TIGR02569 family protein [Cellulomonas hominis]|uniref:TIGR02569 family protein n=1 Tax=Cellulomonas hominis TaxID=156981 RepID=A0A7Z8NQQ9_9CELL|nr:TIGR02569 family protein [Cellulomonas hominis]TKR25012.1 TIGR02569 family protein [Cellulomonas hominis]
MDDDARAAAAPRARVLAAFGCTGEPEPLAGGRGTAWRCGDLVLKPLDGPPGAVAWAERVLGDGARRSAEVRWTAPVRSVGGRLVVDGWTAWTCVEGRHEPRHWVEAIRAGEAFAAALAGSPRPAFLDARSDPWAVADRAAWGECDVPGADDVPEIRALRAALRPVALPAQVVHGDLTGNVLLAAGLPPAVVDPSVYWRPVGYGSAVVVVDALTFEGGTVDLLRAPRVRDELPQLLLRAALFRLLTDHLTGAPPSARAPWGPVVATLRRLAGP